MTIEDQTPRCRLDRPVERLASLFMIGKARRGTPVRESWAGTGLGVRKAGRCRILGQGRGEKPKNSTIRLLASLRTYGTAMASSTQRIPCSRTGRAFGGLEIPRRGGSLRLLASHSL